jgi:agmatinase
MNKQEKIDNFDPNGFASSEALFGLPFSAEESAVWILPVPWEVTVSYEPGTADGPQAILEASLQVDLYDPYLKDAWKRGIYMLGVDEALRNKSNLYRAKAETYLDGLFEDTPDQQLLASLNEACLEMVQWVEEQCDDVLDQNKQLILLGGDHSTPLGFMKALAKRHAGFGILQIDAHADLRDAFEGFAYSHASIMYNALKIEQVERLVQVGIRDFCEAEVDLIEKSGGRITTFFDKDLKHEQYKGVSWEAQCAAIVEKLPQKVYVSFDIDGLDPKLCPNTGTPVAGGFEAEEVLFLLEKLVESGREIIGLDLNEVAPGEDEWDANVAARLLYRLSNILSKSKMN